MNFEQQPGRHGALCLADDALSHPNSRYGYLFSPHDPAHAAENPEDVAALMALGKALAGEGPDQDKPLGEPDDEENPRIASGYTYLGQFIDHDLTFDPVAHFAHRDGPPVNFRTPRFDLDSVYGRGPSDQPYLYRDPTNFLLGQPLYDARSPNISFDVPRNRVFSATGHEIEAGQRALLGDPRNDENRIVSQLHSLFLEFHNAQAQKLSGRFSGRSLFLEAQRLTRWHYQWIVLNDFLPRIVDAKRVAEIIALHRAGGPAQIPRGLFFAPGARIFMPLEFSGAGFRFGHSMVRPSYHFNHGVRATREGVPAERDRIGGNRTPIFSADSDNLAGGRPMPLAWAFDWDFFFEGGNARLTQPSYRIDTLISEPLLALRESGVVGDDVSSLAVRNLLRGARLGLPSAEHVCNALGLAPLSDAQLYDEQFEGRVARAIALDPKVRQTLRARTPLWYYVLRESEYYHGGLHLGPVGGRLVAGVMVGLLFADTEAFVNVRPEWTPHRECGSGGEVWGVRELIEVVRRARRG